MAGRAHQGSAVPSSVRCPLSQDSDSDDVDGSELWNHRQIQQQVEYLNLNGGYSGGLSPQPSSSAECERHVSPQDPNLSSAARYSPPPPYSSPMAGLEASLEHPDSPMEDLSHAGSLPSLPSSVTSSITSATESLVVSESHRLPPSSRSGNLVSANSLFSSPSTLPRSQPRWPSPDVMSDDEDNNVSPTLGESIWAKQKRLAMGRIVDGDVSRRGAPQAASFRGVPQPGPSGLQSVLQPCSSGIQAVSQPGTSGLEAAPQPSRQVLPRRRRSDSSDSDASGDSRLPRLGPTPGSSGIRGRLGRLSEAEALGGAGREARSSARGRVSPSGSPRTPTDNCIVSSSTGHVDSVPPAPAGFRGNDASGPSSPVSPSLASVAILDSTVDSTSGRGMMDPGDRSSDSDDSDREDLAPAGRMPLMDDEGDEISTSEVGLQHSDDSQDVALLVSPQGMFTSGRASANRFMEQLSLSLSHFSGNALDASLSGVESGQHSPTNTPPPPPDPGPYLGDPLAIPGSSRASLPCTSKAAIRRVGMPADQGKDQPSTSGAHSMADPVEVLGSSLPLLDIASGLPGCSTASDADHLRDVGVSAGLEGASVRLGGEEGGLGSTSGGLEPLVSLASDAADAIDADNVAGSSRSQDFGQLSQSYVLELNDESSVGSEDALSSGSLGKDDLAEGGLDQRSFDNLGTGHQSLLDARELSEGSSNNALSLTAASSKQSRVIETDMALPGSSQQTSLAQHLLPSQPDQVSLLVGDGDDSSDGALLMMVSSNSNSIHNTLSLEKQLKEEESSLGSHLRTTASQSAHAIEGTPATLEDEDSNKVTHNEVNSTAATSQEVEAEFIGADFWCGECEQTYTHECPQHHIQEETDKSVRTRTWRSLPGQQLVIPKIPEREGCGECGQPDHDCQQHHIQAISDKPVQTRAWASLPAQHLIIRKVANTEEFGVFARKPIPKRTQFGPLEGIMTVEAVESIAPFGLVYTIISGEEILHWDISDEGSSNWMRFVRKASTYLEQNCVVMQVDGTLFFLTTTDIASRTELRVGYSKQYADRRNLPTLEPTGEEMKILDSLRKSWPCYECDEGFETSAELQQHLVCHEDAGEEERKKRKRIKTRRPRGNGENGTGMKRLIKRVKACGEGPSVAGTSQAGTEGITADLPEGSLQHRQCMMCCLVFTMPEVLRIHQLSHERADVKQEDACAITLKEENKTCPQCIKVFETDVELSTHVEEHSFYLPVTTKRYKCDFCYKSFSRRDRLEAHTTVHGNEAEKPFGCNLCLKQFCSSSALNNHIKFHTEGSKGYDCPICREEFSYVANLKTHVSTHCVKGEYECPTCNKVFPTYNKIRRHIRSYHAVMPRACSICSKEMPSLDKLKIHMLSHSDRRDFHCQDCGKRFKRKDKLREHSKRMHSTEREARTAKSVAKAPPKFVPKVDPTDYKQFVYKCYTCLLGFKRRGMLVNHLAKRHPSVDLTSVPELNQPILKATRCYYCQYCDKMYRSSSKRKLHILKYHPGAELPPPSTTHNENESGEGPSFSQTVGATTTKPHPCKWCYRQYASRARLLRHQRHQHPDICAADVPESAVSDVDPLVEVPAGLSGELALGSQLVTDGNLLRNHRLVSLARGEPSTSGTEATEDDLLTQAMGEITPLASGDQYVRLVGSRSEGQQVVVGGQQGATLALVTTNSPETVTLSLPAGQFISLIPGLSVAGAASAVTSTSRQVTNSGGSVNIHTVETQEGVGSSGELQGEGVPAIRMASSLGSALNDNEAEAAEQVVLATHQPPSPSNSLVWQQALAFTSAPT